MTKHQYALNNCILLYCGDILAFSSEEEHMELVDFVLTTLHKHNLVLRADKSWIGRREVVYLGMKITDQGICIDPDKVKAIWGAKRPTDAAGIRRVLGMAGFLRAFIPRFGPNTRALTSLLRKGEPFKWTAKQEEEYQYVLSCITSDNCLAPFLWGKKAILRCDSSAAGWGCVLGQYHGRQFRPCMFISKALTGSACNRPSRDLEAGCLAWACQKLRPFLITKPFVVLNDNSSLQWLR